MNSPEHSLFTIDSKQLKLTRCWLVLGVVALGVAGLFAGVLSNTKSAFFYPALVVHVDLSVLTWFLAMACLLFTLNTHTPRLPMLASAAFLCFAAGAFSIALSAFVPGTAYMSNYIPVIHHPLFFAGLSLILCGVLGCIINLFVSRPHHFGVTSAAWIMLISMLCFIWSVKTVPANITGQLYYEYIFWGGGHALQFAHTQLMLVCWLWLASVGKLRVKTWNMCSKGIYLLGILAAGVSLILCCLYSPVSDEFHNLFTLLMQHGNGLGPLLVGIILLYAYTIPPSAMFMKPVLASEARLARVIFGMSILLFAVGGGLGYLIRGSNVTVPAHYHGSIVGVTLAFMGVCYLLLPQLGYRDVSRSKLAFFQPVIYGGGQLCWITGMAILGAHGVPRKTPGSADTIGAFASFLKHGGDGLAVIGGLLFVFIMLRAMFRGQRSHS